jgi:P-type Ca2+ transporter type 2C
LRHPIPSDRFADIAALAGEPARGLAEAEVAERRARFGPNAIVGQAGGGWRELLAETARDPMIWLLLGTSILYAAIGDPGDAAVLAAAVVPLAGMDAWLHRRTRVSTEGLKSRIASRATVVRDGRPADVAAADLVPGDLVRLEAGQYLPADGLFVRCDGVQVDESALTGESIPVRKTPLAALRSPAIDVVHWGFAGTRLLAAEASLRVVGTGPATVYAEIVRGALAQTRGRTRLQEAIDRLVLRLVVAAVILCLILGAARLMQGYGLADALLSAVTLAVAAIPEEFPVVFTFFLGVGIMRLARRRALVRRAIAVEDIGRVTCLCMDKTGTLTEGRLRLAHSVPAAAAGEPELLRIAALAARDRTGDPLDDAILQAAPERPAPGPQVALFPFTEERRRETAVYRDSAQAGGLLAVCKGAPETVLALCRVESSQAAEWRRRADELATSHKVIACASRGLDAGEFSGDEPEREFAFAGLLAFEDPLREGAADAVRRAHAAGIRLVLLTGDHPAYAISVAREVGIDDGRSAAVHGDALADAVRREGAGFLAGLRVVARALPAQKLLLVKALQAQGEVVAVTGDGVNDVPALKAADVGIAMGESATQSAREAATIVLMDDELRTIVNAVAEGRQLFQNLRLSFAYLLVMHLPLVALAALVPLAGFPLLFLPIHIVWLELVLHPTAMLAFQAPARRPPEDDPPARHARFFGPREWFAIFASGLLASAAIGAGFRVALAAGGIVHARTLALAALVVLSVASSALLTRLATNAARAIAVLTIVSAVVVTEWPAAASALAVQPLRLQDWLIAAVAGLAAAAPAAWLRPRAMP